MQKLETAQDPAVMSIHHHEGARAWWWIGDAGSAKPPSALPASYRRTTTASGCFADIDVAAGYSGIPPGKARHHRNAAALHLGQPKGNPSVGRERPGTRHRLPSNQHSLRLVLGDGGQDVDGQLVGLREIDGYEVRAALHQV